MAAMRFFSEEDVSRLVDIHDAIEAVEEAFRLAARGEASNRPRERVAASGPARPAGFAGSAQGQAPSSRAHTRTWLHIMPAAMEVPGVVGFKAYVSGPSGSRFMVFLFDAASGEPLAALEAGKLGQLRTGAASAVASRRMARPDSRVMVMFGCGWQASTQLLALTAVLPLRRVWVVGRRPGSAEAFCERMRPLVGEVELRPLVGGATGSADVERAVGEADVVTTITTSREPVLLGRWLRPGTHVNAAGSNHPARQELDAEAVLRAERVVVDDLEQARRESGDLIAAEPRGFDWARALPLAGVVAGQLPGRLSQEEVTLFESQGVALEDVALAARVVAKAERTGAAVRRVEPPLWGGLDR